MNERTRLRSLPGLLIVLAFALCCTRLENGADRFAAVSDGGAFSGGVDTRGSDAGASAGGVAGADVAGAAGQTPGGTTALPSTDGGAAGASNAGEAGGGGGCVDEHGFDGRGCYTCVPRDVVALENACTDATCVWFDNELRLPKIIDGKLPELPAAATGGSGGTGSGGTGSGGGGGSAGAASGGGAGFVCDALSSSGTVVYVTGSSAAKTFLKQIAQQLAVQQDKVFLIYTGVGSCTGVDAIVNGSLMRTGAAPLPASALYWDSSSSEDKACALPAQGVVADLGISDVFAPTCPGFELANLEALRIRDAHGPIQTMTFAVPRNSKYTEISQQAAYLVFGFGEDGNVLDLAGDQAIWNDESAIFQRNASSGTQAMLAAAIGVPSARWKGKPNKASEDVAAALQAAAASPAAANAAIGILGSDFIDSAQLRAKIRVLGYQDSHQACAVTPDSTDTARDKRNVRDGHYPIWGPLHLLYKVNANGDPQNTAIRSALLDIVGYLSGSKALPNGQSLIDVYALSGLIPECAMRVSRASDGGAIVPTTPAAPCSCLFEAIATGSTQCEECDVQGDCSAGQTCSQGYCEQL